MQTSSYTIRALAGAQPVKCPNPTCDRTFTCDACLHGHLMRRYNLPYAEVFGSPEDAWTDFCDDHAACTPSMLGL